MRVEIRVLIRFSYLSGGGFASSRLGLDAVRAQLYDPDRLDRRFDLFEALALPSLAAQTDLDFKAVFLVGDSLPGPAAARLADLLAPHDWAVIAALPVMGQYPALKAALDAAPLADATSHVVTLRLDDDDAVQTGTIARTRRLAEGLLAMRGPERPFVLAFNRGLFMTLTGGVPEVADAAVRTPLGIGLSLVAPVDHPANIYRRNHRALGEHYDLYSEIDRPMFIRTVHADNDSGAVTPRGARALAGPRLRSLLETEFGLDWDVVSALRC